MISEGVPGRQKREDALAAPFLVDALGCFSPGQVVVRWRDEPRRANAALDGLVARVWAEQQRTGKRLFNGRLVRYLQHQVRDGTLVIDAGPTDYANFMATNLFNWQRIDQIGPHLFSNPIGTSGTPQTADGWLLFGRRNQRVGFHAGFAHTFGGGLEPGDCRPDGTLDAFGSIARELHEELRIDASDLVERVCLGLIRDPTIRQPELVFDMRLAVTREEIASRFQLDEPDQEHTELLACRDHPEAILAFIREYQPITPVAIGALCLHGRARFGVEWYERTWAELTEAGNPPGG
jgi:hypothetical protein